MFIAFLILLILLLCIYRVWKSPIQVVAPRFKDVHYPFKGDVLQLGPKHKNYVVRVVAVEHGPTKVRMLMRPLLIRTVYRKFCNK